MNFFKVIIIAFLVSMAGCASLTREECLYGDWFGLGLRDGREGQVATQFVRHQDACREYGVSLNRQQYLLGREQGLQQYCQLDNAIETGLRGYRYLSVCPIGIDGTFRRYNETAYHVYQQREALKSLDSSLSNKEKNLLDTKLLDKDRQTIRDEIRNLDRKRQQLRDELYWAERQLDRLIRGTIRKYR